MKLCGFEIAEAFAASSDQLDELCIHDLVKVVARYQLNSKQEESSGEVSAGEKLLTQQPALLHQYGYMGQVLPLPVRHKCLSVVRKLVYFSTADMIQSLLGVTNISRINH